MKKFYITTSIAYTNARPHIGYALELLQADVLARYHRQKGDDVFFLNGTDEHGKKIKESAEAAGKSPQEFVDEISRVFQSLGKELGVSNDFFIRTTDKKNHLPTVNEFWEKMTANGDIYKNTYTAFYCTGCEAFLNEADMEDGKCMIHRKAPERVSEENYFFRFTKYVSEIERLIREDKIKIIPENRKKEILNLFTSDKLSDISFSRPKESVGWGIAVPGDESQKIYVWADALANYISGLGGLHSENFKKYWPADVHLIGKDITRFHAMIWPAMLLSLKLPLPKSIFVHGFITHDGVKMSKSLGNIVDPFDVLQKYGKDAMRYYLLREIPSSDDGDFSSMRFKERYKDDLQNGLGNLVSRVTNLGEKNPDIFGNLEIKDVLSDKEIKIVVEKYGMVIESFELHNALEVVWSLIQKSDKLIEETKLWQLVKTDETKSQEAMKTLVNNIYTAAYLLVPFLPDASEKIFDAFGVENKGLESKEVQAIIFKKPEPLFPRIS